MPLAQFEKIQDELNDERKDSRNLARERDTALQEKVRVGSGKCAGGGGA